MVPSDPHRQRPSTPRLPILQDAPVPATPAASARRRFLATLSGALAFLALPWRRAQAKKVGLQLGQVAPLGHVGGQATVTVKGREMLLIRDTPTSVRAINPMCTHKACKVFYKAQSNDLACKCHKSKFTLGGKVMGGPAPKPLQIYPARLNGQQIVIELP